MRIDRDKPPLRRLVLILMAGTLGVLAVFAFGRYVEQIDDTFGAIPASWGFKTQSREVQEFFKKGQNMTTHSGSTSAGQMVAQRGPAATETAIFALG